MLSEVFRAGMSAYMAFHAGMAEPRPSVSLSADVLPRSSEPTQFLIGTHVFEDANRNGEWDTGEKPLLFYNVQLLHNGNIVEEGSTDKDGMKVFGVPWDGRSRILGYQLSFTQSEDAVACEYTGPRDNQGNPTGENYVPIPSGRVWEVPLDCDLTAVNVAVCEDVNGNGACFDPEDRPMDGLPVSAYYPGSFETPLDQQTTSANGTAALVSNFTRPVVDVTLPEHCSGVNQIYEEEDGTQSVMLPVTCD